MEKRYENQFYKSWVLWQKTKFEVTSKFIKLCYEYPDLSYSFYWLLRARSEYILDARISKAAKIIDQMCPNFCSFCKSNKQWIRHWLIDCPFFNHIHSKVNDKILFLYNAFNRGNLTNDIVNSNNDNSNSNNSNSNISNSNNSYSNISNSIFSNVSNSIENNVYVDSSVCVKKCLISFLEVEVLITIQGNGRIHFKCQMKSGAYSDTSFHSWWLLRLFFNRLYLLLLVSFKSNRTTTTKERQFWRKQLRQARVKT